MWVMYLTQAVVGIIIAFVYSWKLTLVLIAISPLMGIGSVLQMKVLAAGTQSQAGPFQRATDLAIEVINGFSTVASFNWENSADEKYNRFIDETRKPRAKAVHLGALFWGLSFFFMFAVYALGFWYLNSLF
jgi:ABC-type bacteriocin/lantibiotic exporter with double-glycine peptidase domain